MDPINHAENCFTEALEPKNWGMRSLQICDCSVSGANIIQSLLSPFTFSTRAKVTYLLVLANKKNKNNL
jgi:hypothetical protein